MNLRISFNKTLATIATTMFALVFLAFAQTASAASCTISIIQPTASSYHNGTITINWTDNGDASCATTNVDFKYNSNTNDGGNYYTIASAPANTGATGVTFDTTSTFSGDSVEDGADYYIQADTGGTILDTTGPFTVDNTPPVINTITTGDADLNGYIDTITVTFTDTNPMDTSRTSISGFNVNGHTITAGAWSGQDFVLTIDENTDKTDAQPQVSYSNPATEADRMQDVAGNDLTNLGATTPTDGAAPAPLSSEILDLDGDGDLDAIEIVFSENIGNGASDKIDPGANNENSRFTVSSASNFSLTDGDVMHDDNYNGVPSYGAPKKLVAYFSTNTKKTDVGDLTLAFVSDSSSYVEDQYGNVTANFTLNLGSNPAINDAAAPVIVSVAYQNANTTTTDVDKISVTYTEDIFLNQYDSGDWTITAGIPDDLGVQEETNAVVSGGSGNVIELTVDWADNVTGSIGTEPSLTYTASAGTANSVNDGKGNSAADQTVTMTDDTKPVILSITTLDLDSDGKVDAADLVFSENIAYSTFSAGEFTIGGTVADHINNGGDANDDTTVQITLNTANEIDGTDAKDVTFTNDGDTTGLDGNNVTDVASADITEIDGAAPQITELIYQDADNDGMIDQATFNFSEQVIGLTSTLRLNDVVFTNVGDFTGMAFGSGILDSIITNTNTATLALATPATVEDTRDDSGTLAFSTQTAFSLKDAAGNTTTAGPQSQATIIDGAAPVLLTAHADTKTVGDGIGNTATMALKYTEDVSANTSTTTSDYTVEVVGTSDQISVSSVAITNDLITLNLDASDVDQTTAQLDITYALDTVKDVVSNQGVAQANTAIADKADPVLVGFTAVQNPAGIGDNLGFTLKFSEPMDTTVALTGTTFDVAGSGAPGPYTVNAGSISYTGNTWTADATNSPVVVGTPESGTHTFGAPVAGGVDPAGNSMAVLGTLDLTFVVDSQYPETTGLEATPAVTPLGTPVVVNATVNDESAVGGADLYIEVGGVSSVSWGYDRITIF